MRYVFIAALISGACIQTPVAVAIEVAEQWAVYHNGPADRADQFSVAIEDANGHVIAGGSNYVFGVGEQLLLAKYDEVGDPVWETALDGGSNGVSPPKRMMLDSDHNPVVAAWGARDGETHLIVQKYDGASGQLLWEGSSLPGSHSIWFGEARTGLAIGPDDSIYVAGADRMVARYAPDGTRRWLETPGTSTATWATDMALSSDGVLYMPSIGFSGAGFGIRAINTNGTLLWEDFSTGHNGWAFGASHVGIDPGGNVIVAGVPETTPCGVSGLLIWKYTPAGQLLWAAEYSGESPHCENFDMAGMELDGLGDVIVAGTGGSSSIDITTLKFRGADGSLLWQKDHDGPFGGTDFAYDLKVDSVGNVYVAGEHSVTAQRQKIVTISYDSAGDLRWAISFPGVATSSDRALGLALGRCGRVYTTGYGPNPPHNTDGILIAYMQNELGDLDRDGDVDLGDFAIFQVNFGIATGATPADGDLDGDGDVDAEDAVSLIAAQHTPCE